MSALVSVCTYNVMLSLSRPWRFNGAEERSERLSSTFCATIDADIICFQELTYNFNKVVKSFATEYPFSAGPVSASWCSDSKIRFWPSGLGTVSRYPITHENHYVFTGRTYHVEKFVAKGSLHTRILHPKIGALHVINLHLNAWTTPLAQAVRADQIRQVRSWFDSLAFPPEEPVVFCGDFNVDLYENFEQVQALALELNAKCVVPEGVQFSFDASRNELVGLDDPSEYRNVHSGRQEVPPRQLVDGFLVRGADAATSSVVQLHSTSLFAMNFSLTSRRLARDLSDHFPVVLRFSAPVRQAGEFQTRVVVRDGEFRWWVFLLQVGLTVGIYLTLCSLRRS